MRRREWHLIGPETARVLREWIKGVMRVKAVETEKPGIPLVGPNEFDGLFGAQLCFW